MNVKTVKEAKNLAKDFVALAVEALHEQEKNYFFGGSAATGALRRRSMDLTRALAQMRKSE